MNNRILYNSNDFRMGRRSIVGWVITSSSGAIILQSLYTLQMINTLFFAGIMILHASLLWHFESLTSKWPWIYFLTQALLINGAAVLMPIGFPVTLIALNPVLMALVIIVFQNKWHWIITFFLYFIFFCISVVSVSGAQVLTLLVALFILMTVVVVTVAKLFVNQNEAHIRTQTFLRELEEAHQKVEELTVANERQRMARDLHDTLAQGLAGLIMQLEAVDAHLTAGNSRRAHDIILQSMGRARSTLKEARHVIDNLRMVSVPHYDLAAVIREECDRYKQETGLRVHLDMNIPQGLSKLLTEHILQIVRECLFNVAKHADADQVWIRLYRSEQRIHVEIQDDGKGFDTDKVARKTGHYGLLGIQERVRIIGGEIDMTSGEEGTLIQFHAPLQKGAIYEI